MELVFYLSVGFLSISLPASKSMVVTTVLPQKVQAVLNETRRILNGREITDSRPYMVYLKLPHSSKKHENYHGWVCSGVIVHEEYILTSAACVEDAEHFYVVSGTYSYSAESGPDNNECIENGRKKAVWKCVPKDYVFDGYENDNIRWLYNDIAIVKVEDPFSFSHKVKGCDFIPQMIAYNNRSVDLETPGTKAAVSGWGSTAAYKDWITSLRQSTDQSLNQTQNLLEADVELIEKVKCKKRWGERYEKLIEKYMICTKDASHGSRCEEHADCVDIGYDDKAEAKPDRRQGSEVSGADTSLPSRNHTWSGRRNDGGFCENDHGGPLVHGYGTNAVVIGIISAALVKEKSHECYGPFLYTSIYFNRDFINCILYKTMDKMSFLRFKPGVDIIESTISWDKHPDGPAKSELHTLSHPVVNQNEKSDKMESIAIETVAVP